MEKLFVYFIHFTVIFSCLIIYYFVPITIAYYFLYIRNKEKFRQFKIQQKYPTNIQIKREIKYSIISMFIFSLAGLLIYEYSIRGLTSMYFKISDYGMFYFFISFFITIFVNDTLFYWSHRFMHLKSIFRYVHLSLKGDLRPPLMKVLYIKLTLLSHSKKTQLQRKNSPTHSC